jgi:hypothetical protein
VITAGLSIPVGARGLRRASVTPKRKTIIARSRLTANPACPGPDIKVLSLKIFAGTNNCQTPPDHYDQESDGSS